MRSLYFSHNGMLDPLGQSQVLPYLIGLARRGIEIEIVSYEGAATTQDQVRDLGDRLATDGVAWTPLIRTASHSFARKAWEASRQALRGLAAALARRPDIVHARSYLPAAAADIVATLVPRARLLFDCRGMLGDEYVDGGHWTRDQFAYRLLKSYERRLFSRSEGVVVLTEALRRWLRAEGVLGARTVIEVVPCCVDTDRFRPDEAARDRVRRQLGLEGRTVIVYSGTLGSWYREREMARFAGEVKKLRGDAALLVLTTASPDGLRAAAMAEGLAERDVVVRRVPPRDMPETLAAGDLGLSFIDPCFSKMGSSPTKVAEYLASGLPVVVNSGVGDQDDLAADPDACVVLPSLDPADSAAGARRALELIEAPRAERSARALRVARARFSLADLGVPRYEALYRTLCA